VRIFFASSPQQFYWWHPSLRHAVHSKLLLDRDGDYVSGHHTLTQQEQLVLRSIIVLSERLHRISRQEVRKQLFYHPLNFLLFVKTGRAMIGAGFPNCGGAYSARSVSKPNPSAIRSSY